MHIERALTDRIIGLAFELTSQIGLLLNFNASRRTDGLRRLVV